MIDIDNVSKCYRLGQFTARTLREEAEQLFNRFRTNRAAPALPRSELDFWALRDISFSVQQGEVVGIIGRNGAGKSTLLKILSRITSPTLGQIRVRGRIASLLEVGTGFHPELTGRENIYLNGTILGMTKAEIRDKFDEIVAFAETEKFLDTPVKRYSSGMTVRLAFAVAAHLEPEILIVDEVLAVGDVLFQEKCLGKMKEVSRFGGRTVIFVSHNMGAIQSLCKRVVVMNEGRTWFDGVTEEAVRFYLGKTQLRSTVQDLSNSARTGTGKARVLGLRLEDDFGRPQVFFRMGQPMNIVVTTLFSADVQDPTFGINIVTDEGIRVADCRSSHYGIKIGRINGKVEYRMRIDSVKLYPRVYSVEPWITDAACISTFDWVSNATEFLVTSADHLNVDATHGVSYIATSWEVCQYSESAESTKMRTDSMLRA